VFYRWQTSASSVEPKEFLALRAVFDENGAAALRRDRSDGRTWKLEQQNEALRAKLAKKDEVIAEFLSESA